MTSRKAVRRKMQKKRSANNARFRPGTTGACEAQLWTFTSSQRILSDDNAPGVHWVAAEFTRCGVTLHAAAQQRFHDYGGPLTRRYPPALGLTAGLTRCRSRR